MHSWSNANVLDTKVVGGYLGKIGLSGARADGHRGLNGRWRVVQVGRLIAVALRIGDLVAQSVEVVISEINRIELVLVSQMTTTAKIDYLLKSMWRRCISARSCCSCQRRLKLL